jgi:predicted esterase
MPLLAAAGEDDHLLPIGTFAHGLRIYRAAGARVEYVRHPATGHALCLSDARELRGWLAQRSLTGHAGTASGAALATTA